jgi:hypothetical protein
MRIVFAFSGGHMKPFHIREHVALLMVNQITKNTYQLSTCPGSSDTREDTFLGTCVLKQHQARHLVRVLKLWYKTEKPSYDESMPHVVGKTQGQELWLIFFVGFLSNYN